MRTVFTQDLIEISLQANDNLDVLLDLIDDHVTNKRTRDHIFPLLCELTWINNAILLLLRRDFKEIEFKAPDQKEILIADATLQGLLTLVSARWQANLDLTRFSYSIGLH